MIIIKGFLNGDPEGRMVTVEAKDHKDAAEKIERHGIEVFSLDEVEWTMRTVAWWCCDFDNCNHEWFGPEDYTTECPKCSNPEIRYAMPLP